MDDMTEDTHNGLYRKIDELGKTLNDVNVNVSLATQEITHLREKVIEQNSRVVKTEVRLDNQELINQQLLTEMKNFNMSEGEREKSRKSLRMWLVDNVSSVMVAILIGYLFFRWGF